MKPAKKQVTEGEIDSLVESQADDEFCVGEGGRSAKKRAGGILHTEYRRRKSAGWFRSNLKKKAGKWPFLTAIGPRSRARYSARFGSHCQVSEANRRTRVNSGLPGNLRAVLQRFGR